MIDVDFCRFYLAFSLLNFFVERDVALKLVIGLGGFKSSLSRDQVLTRSGAEFDQTSRSFQSRIGLVKSGFGGQNAYAIFGTANPKQSSCVQYRVCFPLRAVCRMLR